MATKAQSKKGKKSNPAIIFAVLAVASYVLGFPLPVTAFLGFVAYILFKANKDARTLKDLPVPPAEDQQTDSADQGALSTDFGRDVERERERTRPDIFEQEPSDSADEAPAPFFPEYQGQTPQPKPAPVYETTAPVVTRTTTTRQRPSPYRIDDNDNMRLVEQFRSAQGLRQAIVAMTVLGPPRALDPYVSDPMRSTTLGAAKRVN